MYIASPAFNRIIKYSYLPTYLLTYLRTSKISLCTWHRAICKTQLATYGSHVRLERWCRLQRDYWTFLSAEAEEERLTIAAVSRVLVSAEHRAHGTCHISKYFSTRKVTGEFSSSSAGRRRNMFNSVWNEAKASSGLDICTQHHFLAERNNVMFG